MAMSSSPLECLAACGIREVRKIVLDCGSLPSSAGVADAQCAAPASKVKDASHRKRRPAAHPLASEPLWPPSGRCHRTGHGGAGENTPRRPRPRRAPPMSSRDPE